jgi:hypothetical protein
MVCTIADINDVLVHMYRTTGNVILISDFVSECVFVQCTFICVETLPETLYLYTGTVLIFRYRMGMVSVQLYIVPKCITVM